MEPSLTIGKEKPEINTSPKDKSGKGLKISIIICAILAAGGLGFGIYEMLQVESVKQQLSDLKIEVKNTDGSTTTIETDKIEVKDDDKTVVITDASTTNLGFEANNFAGGAEYTISFGMPEPEPHTLTHVAAVMSPSTDAVYPFYTLKANGQLEAHKGWFKMDESVDITAKFSSKVSDLAVGQVGNGGASWLIALLEDNTIATLPEPEIRKQFSETATLVVGAEKIAKVYGNFNESIETLGYAQDYSGKIHRIVVDDVSNFTFKLAD